MSRQNFSHTGSCRCLGPTVGIVFKFPETALCAEFVQVQNILGRRIQRYNEYECKPAAYRVLPESNVEHCRRMIISK